MAARLWIAFIVITAAAGSAVAAAFGQADGPQDDFGYVVQEQPIDWVDPTITGTLATFPSPDNAFTSPINFGFPFPFYENEYSQLIISTNGLITFGQGWLIPLNAPIPTSANPNDLVALFWDDLSVGGINSGSVYYQQRGQSPNRTFVVAYEGVSRVSAPAALLTFEAIFHENGDLCLQYLEINGQPTGAVAGIENATGTDGIDQSAAIAESAAFCFIRPVPAARAKITPAYAGGFTSGLTASYQFVVENTGDLGTDTYDLDFESVPGSWTAEFFFAANNQPLSDTDGSGITDTGPIPQGGQVSIGMIVHAPSGSTAGAFSEGTVTATSQLDPSAKAAMSAQTAVPTSFVQAFRDTQTGMRLQFNSPGSQLLTQNLTAGSISGHTMAVSAAGPYFVIWEDTYTNQAGRLVTDLEFSVLSPSGTVTAAELKLTDNGSAVMQTHDRFAAAASSPNGLMAIVFERMRIDEVPNPNEINSNIYFVVLNPGGSVAAGPVNLTMNNEWRGEFDYGEPLFETPRVSPVGAHFAVSWIDNRLAPPIIEADDVYFMIVDSTGAVQAAPTIIADSDPGGNKFFSPALTSLGGGRVLLAFTELTEAGIPVAVKYTVRDASNGVVKPVTVLAGAAGSGIDAIQLTGGQTLLSWIEGPSGQVNYALLNSSYNLAFGPAALLTPDNRFPDYLSVTGDAAGRGIVTWMDATAAQNLFYALISGTGSVVTPPMAFRSASAANAFILSSQNGGGNAPFAGAHPIYLPVTIR